MFSVFFATKLNLTESQKAFFFFAEGIDNKMRGYNTKKNEKEKKRLACQKKQREIEKLEGQKIENNSMIYQIR